MNNERTISLEDLLPIFDGITDAVFIDDANGICRWCNGACEEMYNVEFDEIEGRHVEDLESAGIFSPSVTKRVLEESREVTIIHENRHGKRLLTTGIPIFTKIDTENSQAGSIDSNDAKLTPTGNEGKSHHQTFGASSTMQIDMVITTSRDITQISGMKDERGRASRALLNAGNLHRETDVDFDESTIIFESKAMKNVMALTKRLATVNSTVLITGESGVGKGLIAKVLHEEGNRHKEAFVTVNCGAIPENLIESELFGYVAGAFTGSRSGGKKGLFEASQNGTIFLDEISELPLNLQVKLLQVIQERQITPVGATKSIPIDVRIISATNRNLEEQVKNGKFREDLYYRLNVVPINVPPLRERPDDIIPLIRKTLSRCNRDLGEQKTITSEALSILLKYPWPGNTRELQNIIERLVITTSNNIIDEEDIFIFIKDAAEQNRENSATELSLAAALNKAEKDILAQALETYKSTRAIARVLKVSQPTVVRKLNKYGLTKEDRI